MTLAQQPQDPSPFEEAAYRAGMAAGFHYAWARVARDHSRAASELVLREAQMHGLTGEEVTWQ